MPLPISLSWGSSAIWSTVTSRRWAGVPQNKLLGCIQLPPRSCSCCDKSHRIFGPVSAALSSTVHLGQSQVAPSHSAGRLCPRDCGVEVYKERAAGIFNALETLKAGDLSCMKAEPGV